MALFVVTLLVVGGAAVALTAAYLELRPSNTGGSSTVRLTDDLGRSVNVPSNPSRIAVLGASIMDSVYRLGLRSHVVAIDCYAPALGGLAEDYSPDQLALWSLSGSLCVQVAPTFNFEALLNDSPQLVLATTLVTVAAVEEIESTYHIPVLMLQPPTLNGVETDLSMLAQIFGVPDAAASIDAQIQSTLAVAQNITTQLSDSGTSLPSVLVTYAANPVGDPTPGYWTYGPGSFGQSLIELVGAVSIAANSSIPYPLLSGGQVLVADPEFVIYGTGFGFNESTYAMGPDWSSLPAVESGAAYGINSNYLTEPDPTMVLAGLPELLHILHPALA